MTDPIAMAVIGSATTVIVTVLGFARAELRWRKTKNYREAQVVEQGKETADHSVIKSHLATIVNGGLEKQIEQHLEKHLTAAISRELKKLLPKILQDARRGKS